MRRVSIPLPVTMHSVWDTLFESGFGLQIYYSNLVRLVMNISFARHCVFGYLIWIYLSASFCHVIVVLALSVYCKLCCSVLVSKG
ncbi:hypothetical protein V1517DRAFT_327325 [Lipomyces orientalis]|uniref:Uncharacterized protein n=1 Tax=Lipomyces orientalis TaxID=1233043 RepID=A0ACC3TLY7_9ASCO